MQRRRMASAGTAGIWYVEPTRMAYFPDGERYTYYPQDHELACVGWLSVDQPFRTATPSAEFLEKLAWLCVNEPELRMRGFHTCDLCPATVENTETVGSIPFRRPEHVLVKGRKVLLGSAEIRVRTQRATYAAPNLILHYVSVHHYEPLADFIEGVLGSSPEHRLSKWSLST